MDALEKGFIGGQQVGEIVPAFFRDLVVLAQAPVGGVALFCLREIARAGQPVDGGIGEDDAQRPLTAFFQQGGKLPDVMLLLVEQKENEQLRQGFFQVFFQTAGTAGFCQAASRSLRLSVGDVMVL